MQGNLAKAYFEDIATTIAIDNLTERKKIQPMVYQLTLVNDEGDAMTWRELCKLGRALTAYAEKDNPVFNLTAARIDKKKPGPRQWQAQFSVNGRRKYLEVPNGIRYKRCDKRAEEVSRLGQNMAQAAMEMPRDKWGERMQFPPAYFGFSKNGDTREDNHDEHHCSSYRMNVAEACAMDLFDDAYQLYFLPVYLVFDPEQATPAEIFFTRIGHGYAPTSFSKYPAGRSCRGVDGITTSQWRQYQEFAITKSAMRATHAEEQLRVQTWIAELRSAYEAKQHLPAQIRAEIDQIRANGGIEDAALQESREDTEEKTARCKKAEKAHDAHMKKHLQGWRTQVEELEALVTQMESIRV